VQPVVEPPRRAAQRTAWVRSLYIVGAVFAIITGVAASRADLLPGDLRVTRALQRTRSVHWDRFWRAVAWAGFPRPTFLVIATATVALWLTRFRLEALFLLLATGVNALNFALKRLVRRKRPAEPKVRVLRLIKEPSFPSGHVMFYMSAFGFLVAAALANLRPSALRRAIVAIGGSLIGLVGASRIYLGAHWPSDVAAGYLFGGLYLGGVLELYTRAKRRQVRRSPPSQKYEGMVDEGMATEADMK
jgi:undecaprenyl-diphosphatase